MRKVNEEGTESGRRQLCKMPLAQGAEGNFIYKRLQNTRTTTIGTILCGKAQRAQPDISFHHFTHVYATVQLIIDFESDIKAISLQSRQYQLSDKECQTGSNNTVTTAEKPQMIIVGE